MIKLTRPFLLMLIAALSLHVFASPKPPAKKVVVAYVTSWTRDIPDPQYITHINYAFGHVSDGFDSVRISNPERLKQISGLKSAYPSIKVLLSVGGWGSGKFSEMAATEDNRKKFAHDCVRVIKEFNLDGIDIDWEFPTSSMAKISSSPDDTKNYTLLMEAIRKAIGKKKLLTLASIAGAKYIDYAAINPYIDFVNIMAYDISSAPQHHAGLYRSELSGHITADESVTAHFNAGIPLNKLVLGIPFYGHGKDGIANFIDYKDIIKLTGYEAKWDDVAKAPYLVNAKGDYVCTYETPESIAIKCQYISDRGLGGAMYWEYSGDTADGILRRTVFAGLNNSAQTKATEMTKK